MKAKNIFVGVNGATISLSKSAAVAVFPPQKGAAAVSYALTTEGKVVKIEGARWGGVGVPRYLKEHGFEQATKGHELAYQLADKLDVSDGVKLVEDATRTRAAALQREFAGKSCTFVPFDETKAVAVVTVEASAICSTVHCDLQEAFASGCVKIDYVPGSNLGWELPLCDGWLIGPDGDAKAMPRNTEYGGTVEKAVYVICNSGLGMLAGERNLVADAKSSYPRGVMRIALENGDVVQVGVDGADTVQVGYLRLGAFLHLRSGINNVRLGDVIGAIAAVIVRVREQDAEIAKKAIKKAA